MQLIGGCARNTVELLGSFRWPKKPGWFPAGSSMHTRAGAVSSFPLSFEQNFPQYSERSLGWVCEPHQTPLNGSDAVEEGNADGARLCPYSLVPAEQLCFYLSYIFESLTMFFEERDTHWKIENHRPTGFIYLLKLTDIVLGTRDRAVKPTDKNPKRSLWLLPGE